MRLIVQRVGTASVSVEGEVVGRIERGLLVYVGVGRLDDVEDVEFAARKIAHLRIFEDDSGRLNLDVSSVGGEVLVVSNFTLLADTRQGRRPAFVEAAEPEKAETLYDSLCDRLRSLGLRVSTGRFRQRMHVSAVNEGPINILVDSRGNS